MASDDFTTPDLLTLIIAAWGAALSTVLAARDFARDRRRVRVIVMPTIYGADPEAIQDLWGVRVVNVSQRPIEIRPPGLITAEGHRLVPRQVGLGGDEPQRTWPARLNDGESVHVYFPAPRGFEPAVRGAWARDMLDREHVGHYPPRTPRARWRAWRAERAFRKLQEERKGA